MWGTHHQVTHLSLLGLEGGSCRLVRHCNYTLSHMHCPVDPVLFTILPRGKKVHRDPLMGAGKQPSEQGAIQSAHLCFDLGMRLATALSWLHCILSTPLVMSNRISPPLKYGPFQILSSFPKCFFPLFLNRCSV